MDKKPRLGSDPLEWTDSGLKAFKLAKRYDPNIQGGIKSPRTNWQEKIFYTVGFIFLLGCGVGVLFLVIKLIKFFWYL